MSRYRVLVHGVIYLDTIPGFDPLDPRPAGQQLEGVTTADFLRAIDAWQHLRIGIYEPNTLDPLLQKLITRKVSLGGWHD